MIVIADTVRRWIANPPGWLRDPHTNYRTGCGTDRNGPRRRRIQSDSAGPGAYGTELVLDDRDGRREAERRHIHAIGTLGVLRMAAKRRLLNLKDALTRLRATNFYIAQELFDRLMAEAEE